MSKRAKKKSTPKKKPTQVTFGVSIQKVLEKMKAIVEAGKEQQFLEKCARLKDDRFVVVNARIVRLVKKFAAEHALSHDLRTTQGLSRAAAKPLDDETCFERK